MAQTARRLKADLINLGVGGACFCEPAFADYIAGLTMDLIHPGDYGMQEIAGNLAARLWSWLRC